jgi:hypothetical protein
MENQAAISKPQRQSASTLNSRIKHLESLVQLLRDASGSSNGLDVAEALRTPPSHAASTSNLPAGSAENEHEPEHRQGHILVDSEGKRYVGAAHWQAICDSVSVFSMSPPPSDQSLTHQLSRSQKLRII